MLNASDTPRERLQASQSDGLTRRPCTPCAQGSRGLNTLGSHIQKRLAELPDQPAPSVVLSAQPSLIPYDACLFEGGYS